MNNYAVERLLTTVRAEIGYLEKASNAKLDLKLENAGHSNWTKYARDLDALGIYNGSKNGYAWCDMFCDWSFIITFGLQTAMKMTGQTMNGYGAGCTGSVNYYKAIGRFFTKNPQHGDQIFFTNDGGRSFYHTGIVEKVEYGCIYTIEGNTSSAAGVVENGGAVQDKSYSLNYAKIGGYGRPDYSLAKEMEDEDMDLDGFKKLYIQMRQELKDNDNSPYSEAARKWSTENGLIAGNGTVINGEFNYMWEDVLTREQLATVLFRFAQLMGKV